MTHPYSESLASLFGHLIPEMVLVVFACILFGGGLFRAERKLWGSVALGGLLLAFLTLFLGPMTQNLANGAVFGVPFLFDSLSTWTRALAIVTGIVFLLLCWDEAPKRQIADHHACVLLIIAGVCLVGSANDLTALFLALELISIPTYILLYLPKFDDASQEASIKYFLLSIFSSGLLLFGFSYYFGLSGTTNIAGSLQVFYRASSEDSKAVSGLAQIAMLMIAAGLGFRITAAPFHFYAPDVFQGASTSGAALLSFIPKIAGFVAILRVFGFVVPAGVDMNHGGAGTALSEQVPTLFWFLAALTMTVGNILAILQENLKRLLAYSSVAHAGYMLVAVASAPYLADADAPTSGVTAVLFYLAAYGAMTFGIFAVIAMLHRPERPVETVDDLAGLAKSQPILALLVTVLMLSFIGFPFTAGFTGKFFVFFGALSVRVPSGVDWLYPLLTLIAGLNAAVGAWYYLRIITVMYLRNAVKPIEMPRMAPGFIAMIVCVAVTLGAAIPPGANWLLSSVRQTTVRPGPAPLQALNHVQP